MWRKDVWTRLNFFHCDWVISRWFTFTLFMRSQICNTMATCDKKIIKITQARNPTVFYCQVYLIPYLSPFLPSLVFLCCYILVFILVLSHAQNKLKELRAIDPNGTSMIRNWVALTDGGSFLLSIDELNEERETKCLAHLQSVEAGFQVIRTLNLLSTRFDPLVC